MPVSARVALLVALVLAALAAAAPATAPARSLQIGIADDGVLLGGGIAADDAVAAWSRLGVDTVRVQVSWSRVTPNPRDPLPPPGFQGSNHGDPGYHWGVIDEAVGRLVRAGLKPLLMVDGPPPLWASSVPARGNPRYKPAAWQFGAFMAAVASRYGEHVDEYIVWNEPNLPLWLQPQADCVRRDRCTPVSPHTYRAMVRAAYPAVHAADPTATVLAGALAPAGNNLRSRNANMRPLQFIRGMACVDEELRPITTGACARFEPAMVDGWAHHPHSTLNTPDQPYDQPDDANLASLDKLETLLDRLQAAGRLVGTTTPLNLWLDEYGYQTRPPDRLRGIPFGRQDRFLQQAAYVAWRNPRVQLLTQYLWVDEKVGPPPRYTGWQSGLFTVEGLAKPSLQHFDDPFWIDFPRSLLWGQVRPGGVHQVRVEVRPPGSGMPWQTLAEIGTAEDGTWSLQRELIPFASYRMVSDAGGTSATMVAAPPTPSSDPGIQTAEPTTPAPAGDSPPRAIVERRAASGTPGAPLPRPFVGLSIEYPAVQDYLWHAGAPNPVFAELVRTLAGGGNGTPPLRFGGDSTDRTWWNPGGLPRLAGITTDITPQWLSQVATWQAQTGTPIVMGLNLGLNDPFNAASLAGAAAGTLPPGALHAFELGNEPDLYPTPRTYRVGRRIVVRTRKRADGYDYAQYRREVDDYAAALAAAAPGVPLSGGAFASATWDDNQEDLLAHAGSKMPVYGAHGYALSASCGRGRRTAASYRSSLLGPQAVTPIVNRMRQLVAVARAHGAEVRMSELNSAICGGLRDVSDSFAAALWGTDILFALAEAGVKNVDLHTWTGSHYGPVDWVYAGGQVIGKVRPLFYAMLLFDKAAPPGARLLPVGPNPGTSKLRTWGTIDPAGTRRIVVINKDADDAREVVLDLPGGAGAATVERLLAPSPSAKTTVTLGGLGYGASTRDGILKGTPVIERVERSAGSISVAMPPASAALVRVAAARR